MTRSSTLPAPTRRPASPEFDRSADRRLSRVLWINDQAAEQGGSERYTKLTAEALSGMGISSSLLYDPNCHTETDFLHSFDRAYPAVDVRTQVDELDPDIVYVQQVERPDLLRDLLSTGRPVVRFLHDHRLLCLREHKYDPIRQHTCTRTTGLRCYTCPGFVGRGPDGSLELRSLRSLHQQQALHRSLAGCVVGSTYMRQHLVAHGFDPERVHTVPLFAGTPDAAAPEPTDDDTVETYLLFVGQLTRGKGLDILLHALAHLPEPVPLAVIGDGPQASEYRDLAVRLGLDDSVVFLGRRSPGFVTRMYRKSTVLVLPSRSPETFGLVGVEAMSHRLPKIGRAHV